MIPFPLEQKATVGCGTKLASVERKRHMNLFGRQKARLGIVPPAAASLLVTLDLRFFIFNYRGMFF